VAGMSNGDENPIIGLIILVIGAIMLVAILDPSNTGLIDFLTNLIYPLVILAIIVAVVLAVLGRG
jgi:hypothetical protein